MYIVDHHSYSDFCRVSCSQCKWYAVSFDPVQRCYHNHRGLADNIVCGFVFDCRSCNYIVLDTLYYGSEPTRSNDQLLNRRGYNEYEQPCFCKHGVRRSDDGYGFSITYDMDIG